MTMGAAMLVEFDQEAANTRRMLERVPADRLDWRPHPKSMTMGRLASHLAHLTGWTEGVIGRETLDLASPEAAAMVPPEMRSTEDLLADFDRHVAASRSALAGVSDEAMRQPWTLRAGDRIILTMPRAAVMRTMVMSHAVHHRAQLGVYLRLNDIPVPGMYGPSADEAP